MIRNPSQKQDLLHTVLASALIALTGFSCETARADEFHYNDILIGERAAGLGGAFTAISDDPTGIYYNPAGLVYGFENYISVSANSFLSSQTTAKNVLAGQDYKITSSGLTPTYFGFSQTLGKGKLAFAVMVPDMQTVNQDDHITGISTTADTPSSLRRKFFRSDSTYLVGPGYARSIGDRSSVGVSLLAFIRTDNAIDNQFVRYNPDATGRYFFQDTVLDRQYYGLLPKLGGQIMLSDKLALGATVSKRFLIKSTVKSRITRTKLDPGTGLPVADPAGSFTNEVEVLESSGTSKIQSPLTASVGGAWFFSKALLVSADLSYYAEDPDFTQYSLAQTYNWALGSEWYVSDSFALRGGVFSNNANTPNVVANKKNQQDHVDMLGGALSVSLLKPGSSFTLGAAYSTGSGRGQAVAGTTESQELIRTALSLYLSGSYQL